MTFTLSEKSIQKLQTVHEDLQKVINAAIKVSSIEFIITEGIRTAQRQAELFKAGATTTMNSRHLTGHAVDVAAIIAGKADWHPQAYAKIAEAILGEAAKLNIPIIYGGSWISFKDLCHFELNRHFYP